MTPEEMKQFEKHQKEEKQKMWDHCVRAVRIEGGVLRVKQARKNEARWMIGKADGSQNVMTVSCWLLLAIAAGRPAPVEKPPQKPEKTVYDYSLVSFDKKEVPLSTFKGKVLLIVNLASQSIFHDQIALLDELQKTYKDKGLVVIGVPSNDFGAQEPGTDADIQKTYTGDLHVSFPVFARASVRGKDQAALYGFLTGDKRDRQGAMFTGATPNSSSDRTGKVVARFEPHVAPNSPELRVTIEDVLAGTFKPPREGRWRRQEERRERPRRGRGSLDHSRLRLFRTQPPDSTVGIIREPD